jgi:hypothetical protein
MIKKNQLSLIELSPAELQEINGGGIITNLILSVIPSEYENGALDFISIYVPTIIYMTVKQLPVCSSLQDRLIRLGQSLI